MIEDASVTDLMAEEQASAVRERRPLQNLESEIRRIHRERYPARMAEMKEIAKRAIAAAREPLRVLCLSQVPPEAPEATLLWGHYTSNHRGFVITFDENDPWFQDHQPAEHKPCDCGPTIYSNDRPGWVIEDGGHVEPRREFVFTKSSYWAYEKEYRLIRFRSTAEVAVGEIDTLYSFPPSALRAITLGAIIPPPIRQRIFTALSRPGFGHVRIVQAIIDADTYRLNFSPASPIAPP
jgi:hypothetical protein